MEQAIRDAGLEPGEVSHEMTGIIMGSGGPSTRAIVDAADIARSKSPKRSASRAKGHVLNRICDTGHLVQDQGCELFHLFRVRDLEPLHR